MKSPFVLLAMFLSGASQIGAIHSAGFDFNEFDFGRREREIQAAVEACIGDKSSTAVLQGCLSREWDAWDAELNRVYGILLSRLDSDGKAALRSAQRAWITYRDAEYGTISAVMSSKRGTMYVLVDMAKRSDITKARVENLTGHLFTLEN